MNEMNMNQQQNRFMMYILLPKATPFFPHGMPSPKTQTAKGYLSRTTEALISENPEPCLHD